MKKLAILDSFAVWLALSAALILFSHPVQASVYDDFTSAGINTSLWQDSGPNPGLFSQPGDGYLYYSDSGAKKDNLVSAHPSTGAFFVSMQYSNFQAINNQPTDEFLSSGVVLELSDGTNAVNVHEAKNSTEQFFMANSNMGGIKTHLIPLPILTSVDAGWLGIGYNGILGPGGQVTLWYKAGASTVWTEIVACAPNFSQTPSFLIAGNDKNGQSLSFRVNQVQFDHNPPTRMSPGVHLLLLGTNP